MTIGTYVVVGHSNDPDGRSSIELAAEPVEYVERFDAWEPLVDVTLRVPLNQWGIAELGARVRVVLEAVT